MNLSIQNINFKAIVPKAVTKVQNKETKAYEPAIFCEVDCKNKNDYKIFKNLSDSWEYAQPLGTSADWKYQNYTFGFPDPRGHYILKRENGEILAICRTSEVLDSMQIDFLESKPETEFRFGGQMILAGIAKEAIKKGYTKMVVPAPVSGSDKFYESACGFNDVDGKFILENERLLDFSRCTPIQRQNQI